LPLRTVVLRFTEKQLEKILLGKLCPYCLKIPEFVDSACVYHGSSYGMVYFCRDCSAWVGVHKGTQKSLGRLANSELRKAKNKAHTYFDPITKDGLINRLWVQYISGMSNRNKAYWWLSKKMKIKKDYCHIGMFDLEQCAKVVSVCEAAFKKLALDINEYIKRGM